MLHAFSKERLPYLGVGLGYRSRIQDEIAQAAEFIDWIEIVADQFAPLNEAAVKPLADLKVNYTCVSHSLELSLASITPAPESYINSILELADHLSVPWFSDHLACNRLANINTASFVPPFRDRAGVERISGRIRDLQSRAQRPFLFENVAGVIDPGGELDEVEFLNAVAEQADCGILLDIANLLGRCLSLGWDIFDYLDRLDLDRVTQVHVAGGTWQGGHLRDTHDQPVSEDVWSLLAHLAARTSINAVLVERDTSFPDEFGLLLGELDRAREILAAPSAFTRPLTSLPGTTIAPLRIGSHAELEAIIERIVVAAGEPVGAPPDDLGVSQEQWQELRRFGAEVLSKREQLVTLSFPATLNILTGEDRTARAVIHEFALTCPRERHIDDAIGVRRAEIARFSRFALAEATTRGLLPAARSVISLEIALATAVATTPASPAELACPNNRCASAADMLSLCGEASITLAEAVCPIIASFDILAVRSAVAARGAVTSTDLEQLSEAHPAPTRLLIAPAGQGKLKIFRLGDREAAVLQRLSEPGSASAHPARFLSDEFGRGLIDAAVRAGTAIVTHPTSAGGRP